MYASHLLYPFICPGIFRLLHVLAIANSFAMNVGVHVSFQMSVFIPLDTHPGVELLCDLGQPKTFKSSMCKSYAIIMTIHIRGHWKILNKIMQANC